MPALTLLVAAAGPAHAEAPGTVDPGFSPNPNETVTAVVNRPDGKILVGGRFTSIAGNTRRSLALLNADGTLDTSFNPNFDGTVVTVALLPDGKILAGGSFTKVGGVTRNRLARLNADGTLDTSFNPNMGGTVSSIAVQPDGKILAGGNFIGVGSPVVTRNNMARLNADGTLDTGFNPNMNNSVNSIAIRPDGKIVVGGNFTTVGGVARNRLAQLNADGTLDTGFNPGASSTVNVIRLRADGKILVGGSFTSIAGATRSYLARLNANGSVDSDFPSRGLNDTVYAIAEQADGKIMIGGKFTAVDGVARRYLARLLPNGAGLDPEFTANASGTWCNGCGTYVNAITLQDDGNVLVGGIFSSLYGTPTGSFNRNNLARLSAGPPAGSPGTLDPDFNPDLNDAVYAMTEQPDGRDLVGGTFSSVGSPAVTRTRMARLNDNGTLDTNFINPNVNGAVKAIARQADGKVVIGGTFTSVGGSNRTYLARLNADGTLDTGFNPTIACGSGCAVNAVAIQPDGKIVIGGEFLQVGGQAMARVARLNPDGSLDTGFANQNVNSQIYTMALQSDGRILIGGEFTQVGGQTRGRVARLNAAGGLDPDFPDPNVSGQVFAMALQSDGRIVIGGTFSFVNNQAPGYLARLNANGSRDGTFTPGINNSVYAVGIQADDKVVAGGVFTSASSPAATRNRLVRLDANGSLDTDFSDPNVNGAVRSVVIESDGNILIGGDFTSVKGQTRNRVARLEAGPLSPPVKTSDPSISGTASVGQTLTANSGSWTGGPTFTYRWERCDSDGANCVVIDDATGSSYTLTTADTDRTIRVEVTAINGGGTVTAQSSPTASVVGKPEKTSDPGISGIAEVGGTLTADPGTWTANPAPSFSYQWERCDADGTNCVAIAGAIGSSYTLIAADQGKAVKVTVTASNTEGSTSFTSEPTAPINPQPPGPPERTSDPSISGTAEVGGTLTANPGDWTGDPTFTYQWQRCEQTSTPTVAGVDWTARNSAADNSWGSVTYGNGLFVAVAQDGSNRVMTSPDGINWTARNAAAANSWRSVTYGNGLFVAVAGSGTGNRVMTSPDGINWTARTSAADNIWQAVTFGNGLFVAVAQDGSNRVMTSPDGINWTARNAAAAIQWLSVTYGNGLFVAVSYSGSGNRVMTSPDGINWTARSAPDEQWSSVTYGNGLYVAVAWSGTLNRVMTSPDGINWTSRNASSANDWRSVTYADGLFVAVATSGTGDRVMTSPDGINWTSRTSAANNEWRSVVSHDGTLVAVSVSGTGNRVMSSVASDGISCQNISGATDSSYTLTGDDEGKMVKVEVTAANSKGTESFATSPTAPVAPEPDRPPVKTGDPSISGTAEVGGTLTADPGTWSGKPTPNFTYRWERCDSDGANCVVIDDATGSSYTLTAADTDRAVRVEVTATNSEGSATVLSSSTASVVGQPVNTSDPSISGSAAVGGTLTADPGTWAANPAPTFSYQWERCDADGTNCVTIAGATGSSYTLTSADEGKAVRVTVTASNAEGNMSFSSEPTAPVAPEPEEPPSNTGDPSISGTAKVGQTLTADPGSWTGSPSFTYRWERCDADGTNCVAIDGATGPSYTLTAADTDRAIRVEVTATNAKGSQIAASSPSGSVVGQPVNYGAPAISGGAAVGGTLTTSPGTWAANPAPTFSYQWERCDADGTNCVAIDGATGPSYTLTGDDEGKAIRVVVTATNAEGQSTMVSSPTGAVGPAPDPGTPELRITVKTPKKVEAGKNFVVALTTSNVAPANRVLSRSARSGNTAHEVKTCARLPKGLFIARRSGGKVTGRMVCWTRPTLAAGESVTYRPWIRPSKTKLGSIQIEGTASDVSGSGAQAKTSSKRKVKVVKPKPRKPKPPTG